MLNGILLLPQFTVQISDGDVQIVNFLDQSRHGRIAASFDVRTTRACFEPCLSDLKEGFLVGDGFLHECDVLFDVEDLLNDLDERIEGVPMKIRRKNEEQTFSR